MSQATVAPRQSEPTAPTGDLVALIGNPNTGKTSLFNRLCGVRAQTSNFPGTTQEARIGRMPDAGGSSHARVIDLPGAYSLGQSSSEAQVCRDVLEGRLALRGEAPRRPDTVLIVLDATNLPRNLVLAGEALRLGIPTVVGVSMTDLAERRGIGIDERALSRELGCEVVVIDPRRGKGIEELRSAMGRAKVGRRPAGDTHEALVEWADGVYPRVLHASDPQHEDLASARIDRVLTDRIAGTLAFAALMGALFYVVFKLAATPMDMIDWVFASLGGLVESVLPTGILQDLVVNGVIAGIGATVIFLPQIVLLFFLVSLLEDSGYLARASLLTDRLLRPFGLSGHAFVPLLSSHACALPGIMAARGVPDRRQRLATILTAPFMSCTARIPVYVLLTVLLFPGRPLFQAIAFGGCYLLGIAAGLVSSLVARRTILRGEGQELVIELPPYRLPSLRNAMLTAVDRGVVFLRRAGTLILAVSIVLWWLGTYPVAEAPGDATALRDQAELVSAGGDPDDAAVLLDEADAIEAAHASRSTYLGRLGAFAQPVFAPLGYDRQLTIGVLASFAAREVFVSTMAVQVVGKEEGDGVREAIAQAKRDDGTPVFTPAVSWSLLVYYVLAMQCLPTLAVTAREAGHWKWAALQLGWMAGLAYVAALAVFQIAGVLG